VTVGLFLFFLKKQNIRFYKNSEKTKTPLFPKICFLGFGKKGVWV